MSEEKNTGNVGRPSAYTEELAAEICARLAEGMSLRTVCEAEDMPDRSTVYRWLSTFPAFRDQYARAKDDAADAMIEDMLYFADTVVIGQKTKRLPDGKEEVTTGDMVERARLQVETRKWIASKLKPKKYGDRVQSVLTDPDGNSVVFRLESVLTRPAADKAEGRA